MSETTVTAISPDSQHIFFTQDGKPDKASYTFYRGEHANFHPTDESFSTSRVLQDYFFVGLVPATPFLDARTPIVAFGSCFAGHIADYLHALGYNVSTRRDRVSYLASMGEGIVNTYAIRQQFEWAWEGIQPEVDLWHDYEAHKLGYSEDVRIDTKQMFDEADVFIITLGLSEVWYDQPTGQVFWRAVPQSCFDPSRHKFRMATVRENVSNLREIHRLIRRHRPDAAIVLTVSPIPLKATFRPISCLAANSVSKANLRAAVDEFLRDKQEDQKLFYFPSYEVALQAFEHPFMEDRRHVHKHVLDLNMAAFERYFCKTGLTDEDLLMRFRDAQAMDREILQNGHWAVPRANLLFHEPPKGAKVLTCSPK
jgi:hypothetical protein